ncbi:DEAD/DEAH box helicase family protein [Megasphaera butyrica]|uniref:type III restriction-modification system endonuclease n=1 Tax=Megasphaera butyrica TaxID=2981791 RepID=UPI0008205F15|nr:DEAD/DEAH box helicase family protein [Megasphaera butyrica]MCU6713358.1 DEAD/DEAH box helicase family protein [Megasphaera butyrica]SCG95903.1 type III restriction-modification system StyLTI enzyme res [uncultured Megasphaera sp.]SCI10417.1 type III restriction-modification system StyLTI enzyme res [uncultured Ruminococcus sp.]
MRLQFKHQKFQADAAKAVVDVFAGQPYLTPTYMMDRGSNYQLSLLDTDEFMGWRNEPIVPELSDAMILERLRKIQRANQIKPSERIEPSESCKFNLTIEMETGVGKTYTYIKTMYELNKHYGWSKFIVVVPSIAIREGVYKSFQVTQDHFAAEYEKKIRFFIYNSAQLTEIDRFASDSSINVMIINSQAFNARGKNARRIYMKLDEFRSRRPIDIIAKTNPILIIDEPQSVEGKQTKERLRTFNPLLTLRYSATHKSDSIYNMVYRLDAMEAYNKRLVKKIAVKGITESGSTATEGYVYLEGINLSKADPTATIEFDFKGASAIRKKTMKVGIGFNLYDHSGNLDEYKDGFVVKFIDGRDNSLEFLNGVKLFAGDVVGKVSEDQLRRIQIRETILSHIERERQLFHKGIKVLSLFFIDEVAKYKQYDEGGNPYNGIYADMFEEEYEDIIGHMQREFGDEEYMKYLDAISAHDTHAGYFSIDKKGKMTDSKLSDKKAGTSDDIDAYDLIMKNKELLLDRDPKRSPVRFIFSHSALREGWDNPNVFQICTLKQSSSEVRKRQEVGRGLRLCVNQDGERMDAAVLGNDVQNVNILTVIASESYESFAKGLQTEMADAVADRPVAVTAELFKDKVIVDARGNEQVVDGNTAAAIFEDLIFNGYVKRGSLTDKYYTDKANGDVKVAEEVADCRDAIIDILDSVYDSRAMMPENARDKNVELQVDPEKLAMPEFKALWQRISSKSVYVVDFDTEELVRKSISALNRDLHVPKIFFKVETGTMEEIKSKDELLSGESFIKSRSYTYNGSKRIHANSSVKYDLVGKLVGETGLTRKAVVEILTGIEKSVFDQFRYNPEEFIIKAAGLINDEKATAIIQHIAYHMLDERYDTDIFTEPTIKGKLGANAMKAQRHLYDHIVYDSTNERDFAADLDTNSDVAVYVKLPDSFYIATPVGKYNPDWAIAFYEGTVKHIYFVAETKGSMRSMELRLIEESKIHCAREHFKAISGNNVVYDVVDSYQALLEKVMK